MTVVKSTETADVPLSRLTLNLARYYLGNRWVLLVLGALAIILGLTFGGWSWLVAAGLAPVLLTLLPCAIMCAVGLCSMKMMGGGSSESKSDQSQRDAETTAEAATALGVAKMDRSSVGGSSGCHEEVGETQSPDVKQTQTIEERKDSHA